MGRESMIYYVHIYFFITVGLSLSSELFGLFIERFSRHYRHSKQNTHFHVEK